MARNEAMKEFLEVVSSRGNAKALFEHQHCLGHGSAESRLLPFDGIWTETIWRNRWLSAKRKWMNKSNNYPENKNAATPTTRQRILDLAIPATGALLIDLLMTLADTAFFGRFATYGAQGLAGMGSAGALQLLCTATTPIIVESRVSGDESKAVAPGGQALSLALTLGSTLTVTLLTFPQPLSTLMGTGLTAANQCALAVSSVRALAAPAILSIEASTGVLRGYLHTKTPIAILIAANTINFFLDVTLIAFSGLLHVLAWAVTNGCKWDPSDCVEEAERNNHLHVCRWIWNWQVQNEWTIEDACML